MDLNSIFLVAFVVVIAVALCSIGLCCFQKKDHLEDQAPNR